MLEKATAKLFSTYSALNSAYRGVGLKLLTGMPTYAKLSKELTWDIIMEKTKNDYPMVFGTGK